MHFGWSEGLGCAVCELAPRPHQKHERNRDDAHEADDIDVVAKGDDPEPSKCMADIGIGTVGAAHSELAGPLRTRPLQGEQGVW